MVLEISNNNKWEQYYNYHKEEKDLRGYSHFIECNIYLLDEVEKFNVIAIDINSNVVLDLSYKLTSLGRIESNKGEILEFLPEQIVCENAIQCYIEYITSEGECVKKLFTMNDDIMTTRLVVFMHKGNEYVAHNFKVCLYFR
ncbi:MAG: hypothetical protein K2I88_04090 [Anaeroplasmataceae bacterium]|nr:hypothetical protein [Anaeroplasmataceae bacterium]